MTEELTISDLQSSLKRENLVRSRSSLFHLITEGVKEDADSSERFQSDLDPYRKDNNALFALVKGTRKPKRPSELVAEAEVDKIAKKSVSES